MADIGSISNNTHGREGKGEDGFSDYIQANPRDVIMEQEIISESHDGESFSPTPIVNPKVYSSKESFKI